MPTEGDPRSFGVPKCANCGAKLFPRLDIWKNKNEQNDTEELFEEGFLKRSIWPSITSKKAAFDYLSIYGAILAGLFALSTGLIGFLSNSFFYIILSVLCIFSGFEIYKGKYWSIPIISTLGILNFLGLLLVFIQSNGTAGGPSFAVQGIIAAYSFNLIRAWYLSKRFTDDSFSQFFKTKFYYEYDFKKLSGEATTWLKQNKSILGLIFLISVIFLIKFFMDKPGNYNECYIKKMNEAKNAQVAKMTASNIRAECKRLFP